MVKKRLIREFPGERAAAQAGPVEVVVPPTLGPDATAEEITDALGATLIRLAQTTDLALGMLQQGASHPELVIGPLETPTRIVTIEAAGRAPQVGPKGIVLPFEYCQTIRAWLMNPRCILATVKDEPDPVDGSGEPE